MAQPTPAVGFSGLFDRIRQHSDDRTPLQQATQLAVQVEFTTIPAYLTALYSITQPDSAAYQALRSVVVEEMYHVNQAANLLVAIGGLPRFTPPFAPSYPTYLPHANTGTTPYIGLYRASPGVFEDIFAGIETPATTAAPPQGDDYDTIAQLYGALRQGLHRYHGEPPLFTPNPAGRQRDDIYLGKFGGRAVVVHDLETADAAIRQIVQQGEGHVPISRPLMPFERFGAYNHYGKRSDGTYGPIIGTPYELSHFLKFRTAALDNAAFPATYPIVSNARIEDLYNLVAIEKARQFDIAYSIVLKALEASFRIPATPAAPDPYFATALPLMHQVLPNLARALMSTPTRADGDPQAGPNAAPIFGFRADASVAGLTSGIEGVMDLVSRNAADRAARDAELRPLKRALDGVRMLAAT
jgi:Ferritin-like